MKRRYVFLILAAVFAAALLASCATMCPPKSKVTGYAKGKSHL